jgi:subtilisin
VHSPLLLPLAVRSLALLTLLGASGCTDDIPNPAAPVVAEARPSSSRQEPEEHSRKDTPWQRMTDEELAAKIAEVDGQVFIGFRNPGDRDGVDDRGRVLARANTVVEAKAMVRALSAEIVYEFVDMPAVAARISPDDVATLRRHPLVDYVEPSIVPGGTLSQSTPWHVTRVGAPSAWSSSTGSGAKLLIIDTGIDNAHSDLSTTSIQTCLSFPDAGIDADGHGTAVAGVAAAVNNSSMVVGVAYGASLYTSKVYSGSGSIDALKVACAVQYGRTNGMDVINISLQMSSTTQVTDQINAAYNTDDIVVVAAAGNAFGGAVTYPASLTSAIAVSATDTVNAIADFSSVGSKVEIAAPGTTWSGSVGLTTTCLGNTSCATLDFQALEGTSFAAPAVAAAAAILKSYNSGWTAAQIREKLRVGATASDLGSPGRDQFFGYGLLNIPAALSAPAELLVNMSGTNSVKTAGNQSWSCNASGGTGSYSYQWERSDVGGSYYGVGTSSGYAVYVSNSDEPYFTLRCTVTSGTQTVIVTKQVNVIIP